MLLIHTMTLKPISMASKPSWKEVTVRCLCAAWRPLWPECVLQRDFEGFEELEEEAVVHEIVALGNSMGLEVDDDDVEELVEEHSKELSTEELLELHKEENETLKRSLTSEESGEEEDKEESRIIPAKDLKDAFFCWSKLSKLAEDYHPDVGSVQKAISVFNDNVMNYFWKSLAPPSGRESGGTWCSVAGRGCPPRCDGDAHSYSGAEVTANVCCATRLLPVE
ncbi:Tigger transposable element-derived protein 1-like 157 [Homarus americanus]|uniref:Tigger transposable element-derived protein 1-like 157 n=1 Tax=Homarus americanus TaxID=6706 RepID=A0A8J5JSI6_HOMAM|nr:Tigger transposable element-derived protein 1-like 157 [Homarus americanus]